MRHGETAPLWCANVSLAAADPFLLTDYSWLQALLIVVGNPVVLKNDPNWRAFMQQCKDFGAVAGQAMPDLSTDSSINEGSSSSGTDSSMARLLEKLEGLMSSLRLGDAVDAAADYGGLSFSGLTAEVGAGMVRHE